MKSKLLLGIFLFTHFFQSYSQQLSFPTAEGMGKFTKGGRGTTTTATTVFYVTSLADDGSAGTLRYAISQTAAYRTILFKVSGTIHLLSKLNIKSNTTIAGQTAPNGGICISDNSVSISGDNIIVRYIKFRLGDKNQLKTNPAGCGVPVTPFTATCMPLNGSGGDDAFGGTGRNNIMIDHCTFSWSNDEACSIYSGDSTSIQWCVISEPLNYSYHFETGDTDFEKHGYGGIWGGKQASFHHNLFAHCQGRACRFDGSRNLGNGSTTGLENCDFSNNVIYNWGAYNVSGGEGGNYNILNNYYKYGPNTASSVKNMIVNPYITSPLPYGKFYLSGNYIDGYPTLNANNWLGAKMSGGSLADTNLAKSSTQFSITPINLQSATNAYQSVLESAGASIPTRDTLDERIILNVKNRTGKIIDVQGNYPHGTSYAITTNAWPNLIQGNNSTDTDNDGMPDWWEQRNALNKNLASDRGIFATNGYTNLENYIDSIPEWNKHAAFENFSGTKISAISTKFLFNTNWVKDSFTYALFKSNDSLGTYTKAAETSSSMNLISFSLTDNNFNDVTTYYKVGSYKIGVTKDTLYSNIIRINGTITPVKLSAFNAKITHNNNINIFWNTATEVNTSHFNIQKSYNAKTFENIGKLSANGFGTSYNFIDKYEDFNNKIFYKLEIVDFDGKRSYSPIVTLNLNSLSKFIIYPNPSNSGKILVESKETGKLLFINNLGIITKQVELVNNKQTINIEGLNKGIYLLKLITKNSVSTTEKLVIY